MDEEQCPVCKSQKYLNPTMNILVSLCSHKMCENCVERLFFEGSAPCPICGTILRKTNFVSQKFENLQVEKEIQIRLKIAQTYNKTLKDFKNDPRAYNDYLEEVETIDYEATMNKIKEYQAQNKDTARTNICDDKEEFKYERGKCSSRKETQLYGFDKSSLNSSTKDYPNTQKDSHSESSSSGMEESSDLFKCPIDSVYPPSYIPKILSTYNDPWLSAIKIEDPKVSDMLSAGGFERSYTYTKAIILAYTGLSVGL